MLLQKLRTYSFTFSELKHFLYVALPMVVSTGTDAVMMFVDKLFLSQYSQNAGEAYLNAALIGGLTSFVIIAFFLVTAGYSNALVAQYHGAKQTHTCARVMSQVLFLSTMAYPIILLLSAFVPSFFSFFDHSPLQTKLESSYTRILLWGAWFTIMRHGMGGFFTGIHKTNVVMVANVAGMLINIPLNYIFIFGKMGLPAMGIAGAALATIIGWAVSLIILLIAYYGNKTHKAFTTRIRPRFDHVLFKKLCRFGFPSAVQTVFAVLVFDFFISVMSSYGEAVGSAVTIAINWDSMFFIPMLGAGFATTAIVGQHMGARNIFETKRAVFLALTVMMGYAILVASLMLIFTAPLVEIFLGKMKNADIVRPMAQTMVRLACIYLLADALNIGISGALRGAGDTRAIMIIDICLQALFGLSIYAFTMSKVLSPLGSWFVFIGYAISVGLGMLLRFLHGRWQHISVIEGGEKPLSA